MDQRPITLVNDPKIDRPTVSSGADRVDHPARIGLVGAIDCGDGFKDVHLIEPIRTSPT